MPHQGEVEKSVAEACKPCPHGSITLVDSDDGQWSFHAKFTASGEELAKTFSSLPDACQWVNKLDSARLCGKIQKGGFSAVKVSGDDQAPI